MHTETPARGVLASLTQAQTGMIETMVKGTQEYWSNVIERGGHPLDVGVDLLTWWGTMLRRDRPRWSTDSRIVAEWAVARLRDFSDDDAPDQVPTLILPPHAGHDSCIVDFAPDQSQVRTAKAAGLRRLYALDWIGARADTKNSSITTYISVIAEAVGMLGGRVNLVGDSQGGLLAAIFTALYPQSVNTLAVAGATIDYHADDHLVQSWLAAMAPRGNFALYRNLVSLNGGMLPGEFLLGSFISLQPQAELERKVDLLVNIRDEAHVERYRRFEAWFQWTQPLAGDFYLWIVEQLYYRNALVKGELVVGGRTVLLAAIDCPLYLMAGSHDHLTRPEQVWALGELVGTPPEDIVRCTSTGGHLGLFMGHESLREHWPSIFADMANRSRPSEEPAQPEPVTPEPVVDEVVAAEPVVDEVVAAEPVVPAVVTPEPAATEDMNVVVATPDPVDAPPAEAEPAAHHAPARKVVPAKKAAAPRKAAAAKKAAPARKTAAKKASVPKAAPAEHAAPVEDDVVTSPGHGPADAPQAVAEPEYLPDPVPGPVEEPADSGA